MVKSVFLLPDSAGILSVLSELSSDSVNSTVPDRESLMVNSQCRVHLISVVSERSFRLLWLSYKIV